MRPRKVKHRPGHQQHRDRDATLLFAKITTPGARLAVSCSRGRRSPARGGRSPWNPRPDQTRPRPWTVASPEGSSPLLCLAQALSAGRLGQKDKCGPGVKSWGDRGPSRSTRPRGKAGKERSTNTASRGGGSSAGDLFRYSACCVLPGGLQTTGLGNIRFLASIDHGAWGHPT
mgnify:CR=1 FL=1